MPIVYATTSCTARGHDGNLWQLHENEPWDSDDPLVRSRPELFSETPVRVMRTAQPRVESATRAPGETRGGPRTR
ncbi:MAG: hypothetical protein JWO62_2566 [Acidimicrobiaceae bacterium]|nr:hypothetical protein [Acidimicrobiaceae bacterium]